MSLDYGQSSQLNFLDTDDLNDVPSDHLTQQSLFNGFIQPSSQFKSQDDLVSQLAYLFVYINCNRLSFRL